MLNYDLSSRLACSSLLYRAFTLDRALDAIAPTGIGYVDLWAVPGFVEHVRAGKDTPASVAAKLKDRGLRASSISAYGLTGAAMVARLDFAGAIGARAVITTAPARDYDRHEATDDVRALGRAAQSAGVVLCLANHINTWMDTAEAIAGFLDDVGHPRVQLSFGPTHAYITPVTHEALAAAAGNRIGHAYLWSLASGAKTRDEYGDGDAQTPSPTNGVDFRSMLRVLEQRNYNGFYTFMWHGTEHWPLKRIAASLAGARAHVVAMAKAG
ncbi:MAG: sugar phosphate isomerase/epimerase [Actinobacteria bacterium]|nr:sugar phosphate isomerase/epimerase [Actinomycetota bacterium]